MGLSPAVEIASRLASEDLTHSRGEVREVSGLWNSSKLGPSMKSLSRLLSRDRIVWLESDAKEKALLEMVETLAGTAEFPSTREVLDAILEREKLLSTGFGLGLAIPHAKLRGVKDFVVGLGIHREGLDYESLDDKPVHILIMIVGPSARQDEYLRVLSRVTSFLKNNRDILLEKEDADEIFSLTFDY